MTSFVTLLYNATQYARSCYLADTVNALTADGIKFAHPLHHLGKSANDLPLIAIDSFKHMYLFKHDVKTNLGYVYLLDVVAVCYSILQSLLCYTQCLVIMYSMQCIVGWQSVDIVRETKLFAEVVRSSL